MGSWAAASRYYAEAAELTPPTDPTYPELAFRRAVATAWSTGQGYEAIGEAVDMLEAHGLSELAAEAASWTALGYHTRGEIENAYRYADRALALSEADPSTTARLEAVTQMASFQMKRGEHREAIQLAQGALGLADALGATALHARLLNIIGASRVSLGEPEGLADLEASVEVALSSRSAEQIYLAMQNFQTMLGQLGRLEDQARVLAECRTLLVRSSVPHAMQWVTAEEAYAAYVRGRWTDALERADAFLAMGSHYQEPPVRAIRVAILLARGELDAAQAESATALTLARRSEDVQVLVPALWARAALMLAIERQREARALALEILAHQDAIISLSFEFAFDFADLASRLDLDADVERVIVAGSGGFWHVPMLRFVRGELGQAADILAEAGNRTGEARARLRAAERLAASGEIDEAATQLEAAMAFYHSVEAGADLERAGLVERRIG